MAVCSGDSSLNTYTSTLGFGDAGKVVTVAPPAWDVGDVNTVGEFGGLSLDAAVPEICKMIYHEINFLLGMNFPLSMKQHMETTSKGCNQPKPTCSKSPLFDKVNHRFLFVFSLLLNSRPPLC